MTSCQPQGKRNASWFLALFWFIISLLSSCCRVNLENKNLTRWQSSGRNDYEINDLNSAEVRVNGKMWSQHTQPSGRIYSSVRRKGKVLPLQPGLENSVDISQETGKLSLLYLLAHS